MDWHDLEYIITDMTGVEPETEEIKNVRDIWKLKSENFDVIASFNDDNVVHVIGVHIKGEADDIMENIIKTASELL